MTLEPLLSCIRTKQNEDNKWTRSKYPRTTNLYYPQLGVVKEQETKCASRTLVAKKYGTDQFGEISDAVGLVASA